MESVAKKLNVSRASYAHMEMSERDMTIKLATLSIAAEALDCELVYGLRPKTKQKFSRIIWNRLLKRAKTYVMMREMTGLPAARALAGLAQRLLDDTQVRKEMGWAQRRPSRHSPWR
jgi:transcriptional regulator with XRE-family HTH domain